MSDFNKILRRKNRVDILVPFISGVDSYNLQTSVLPITGPWVTRAQILNTPESPTSPDGFGGNVFFSFDPDDYVANLDKHTFYVRLEPVTGGVPGTPGSINAIATSTDANLPPEVINDSAITVARRIPFSRTTISVSIINLDSSNALFVSFEEGGTEISLPNQTDEFNDQGNFDVLYVRGSPAACAFQVVAILSAGDSFQA